MMRTRYYAFFVCLFVVVSFFTGDATAQTFTPSPQDAGVLDRIQLEFFNITSSYQARIADLAKELFLALAVIHIVWVGMKMALKGADLQQWVAEVMKMILFLGFFAFMLINNGFALIIIDSFVQGANIATGSSTAPNSLASGSSGGITPSGILARGMSIALSAIKGISLFKVGAAVLIGISVILIILSFIMMSLRLIMAYIEAYIGITAGLILLGFGGMSFTSDLAKKYLFYIVSVGMKLFVMHLVLGLGMQLIEDLITGWSFDNNQQILLMVAVSGIVMGLTMSVPNIVSGLIQGQPSGGGNELGSIIAGVGGAAAGAAFLKAKLASGAAGGGKAGGAGSAIGGAMSVLNNKGGNGKK